ncbi:MAG: hypothetical protein WCY98_05250 [Castellaniella sp.]
MSVARNCGAVLLLTLLGGCALHEQMNAIFQRSEEAGHDVSAHHQGFQAVIHDAAARPAAQRVDRPWVAGRPQALARELRLPPALRAQVPVTLLFADDWLDLPEIAHSITAVTGIPVHVRPEALLPVAAFMPRLEGALADANAPAAGLSRARFSGESEPLARILDRLSAALGVRWTYAQERIEFYRTETRVFDVRALTLEARTDATLGSVSDPTGEGGFASSSRTTLSTGNDVDVLAVVKARMEPFMSRAGIIVAQAGASASVVVTDTPDALDRIARYLERENRVLTRRVRLVFEEVTLASRDAGQLALDWNLVFASARAAVRAELGETGDVEAGRLAAGVGHGPFRGSELILAALGQSGRIVRRSSVPVLTLNRRPVTHAVRTTFSYIDRVDTTPFSDGQGLALPSVSVSQKEETVGSLLTLVPDAQDDGRILLSIAYDNTVAQPLRTIRFGDRDHPLQLQQLTVDGNGTVQQVLLQAGEPMLISGFERRQDESLTRRLNPDAPLVLGGSDKAVSEQLMTVIIVTARVEEEV